MHIVEMIQKKLTHFRAVIRNNVGTISREFFWGYSITFTEKIRYTILKIIFLLKTDQTQIGIRLFLIRYSLEVGNTQITSVNMLLTSGNVHKALMWFDYLLWHSDCIVDYCIPINSGLI